MGNYNGAPLAVGGYNPNLNKAETFNIESNTWTEREEYPFHDSLVFSNKNVGYVPRHGKLTFSIRRYATVTIDLGALIIGGYPDKSVRTVACFNESGWTKLNDLQSVRFDHSAIVNGDKVYVIGGSGIP